MDDQAPPATTAPEQLHLQWGRDPATSVTVSWLAPGGVPQPAPTLAYSTEPITPRHRGRVVRLPAPAPLDLARPRAPAAAVSFTDGLSGRTTYHYHVQLTGLRPDTTYHYQVSDGAGSPSAAGGSFRTAPAGRARFRFTSYGDLGTPTASHPLNVSGRTWTQSHDTSVALVDAVESPGDGGGPPLFHLLNGDLAYGNLDPDDMPGVWRDFGVNVARSAAGRPWMPTLGNHDNEFGVCRHDGAPGTAPGGPAAQGAAGNHWNGPYGNGHYQARFQLPDNGVRNHDGNRLQGQFYSFQVGTVLFVALDADDVTYQQNLAVNGAGGTFASGAAIPAGAATVNRAYTGELTYRAGDNSLVPGGRAPNLQTAWLERTLRDARREGGSVEMIVAFLHQCPLSTSLAQNGSDLGIRQAWGPLFDRYQVDLVLSGHEHDYQRSYPVRGYDPGAHATVTTAFGPYAVGDPIDTRRPAVVTTEPADLDGVPAWNTARGTVYLVLGGGGATSDTYCPPGDRPEARVWTTLQGRNALEDAPWSAVRDGAHGYAVFDVDPGPGPGGTTITFQWFRVPAVTPGEAPALPSTPYETFVFGRQVPAGDHGGGRRAAAAGARG